MPKQKSLNLLFAISAFYADYSKELLENALLELKEFSITENEINKIISLVFAQNGIFFGNYKLNSNLQINIIKISGSLELPQAVRFFLETRPNLDGIITLGIIKKGDTKHDEYVTTECMRGLSEVSKEFKIPLSMGIITAESEKLIKQRVSSLGEITLEGHVFKGLNIGGQATKTCLDIINLKHKLQ